MLQLSCNSPLNNNSSWLSNSLLLNSNSLLLNSNSSRLSLLSSNSNSLLNNSFRLSLPLSKLRLLQKLIFLQCPPQPSQQFNKTMIFLQCPQPSQLNKTTICSPSHLFISKMTPSLTLSHRLKMRLKTRLKTICLPKWNQFSSNSLNSFHNLSQLYNLTISRTSSLNQLRINKMTTMLSKSSSSPICTTMTSILRTSLLPSLRPSISWAWSTRQQQCLKDSQIKNTATTCSSSNPHSIWIKIVATPKMTCSLCLPVQVKFTLSRPRPNRTIPTRRLMICLKIE